MVGKFLAILGWSNRQWLLFLSVLSAFMVLPLLSLLTCITDAHLNNWLLLVTGIVVLVYTVETLGLRVEMVRQNEIAIQPLLIATIEDREVQRIAIGTSNFLVLRNVGRGTALFVKIEDIEFAELEGQQYAMKFNTIDFIEPGRDCIVQPNVFRGKEQTASPGYVSHLDPRYAIQNLTAVITYEDVNGQGRRSVVQMGKNGIRLLGHSKIK